MSLRVVSLLPAATEMICALGAIDELVGISHECDFPEKVRTRPALTRSRLSHSGQSRAIDAQVRQLLESALSIYEVDEAALGALRPDVIVTQDLCEVCAVSLDDVRSAVARMAANDSVHIVSLKPLRFDEVISDIGRVATALHREAQGVELVDALSARVESVRLRARNAARRPRVITIEWLEPIMLGGTWMPELIEFAGGTSVGANTGGPAPTVSAEELEALAPEVVVIKPCGFDLERALEERELIERMIVANARGARVYLCDGNAYFNRPGPRLVESLELLAACVHPELFMDFANEHRGSFVEL